MVQIMLCAAPFIHQFIYNNGKANLCCSAERDIGETNYNDWNGKDYQKIRKHMLEEKELPDVCIDCVINERVNNTSTRKSMLNTYETLGSPKLDIITGTSIDAPVSLDLRMNNICNLSCRMCGPTSSSQIAKEQLKHPELWTDYPTISDRYNKFDAGDIIQNAGAIFELKLLGGEPSLQPESKALLRELIHIGNTHIKLFITTNGTNYNKDFWELVEKFKDVSVRISIDSWGKQHEYLRGPATHFETIWKNAKKIAAIHSNIRIQQTVTSMNIFDFWKLRKNSDLLIDSFICYSPDKYAPKNIPVKWKEYAIQIAKDNDAYKDDKHIFDLMMDDGDTNLLKGFKQYTQLMDSVRGQYMIDYFPITYKMLEEIE